MARTLRSMDTRIRTLLSWQLRFQSRRMSTWMFGGGYVLVVLGLIAISPKQLPPGIAPAVVPFGIVKTVHALAAFLFAMRGASQSLDDKLSGTLGFLKVSNLAPGSWVTFRFVAILLEFLPIWLLRLPVDTLIVSLGGVTLGEVVWLEAVSAVTFLTMSCLGLLIARFSTTGNAVFFGSLLVVGVLQLAFNLPLIAMAIWMLIENRPFSLANHAWAEFFSRLALPRYFWSMPGDSMQWWLAVASLALHLILGAVLLRMLVRTVYFEVGTEIVEETTAQTKADRKSTTRSSRRVWDDALAWQAVYVHCPHSANARLGMTLFAAAAIAVLLGIADNNVLRTLLIGVPSGMALAVLAFKSSDCLTREIKGKTLSTLAMLPLDGQEIYGGWARGSRIIARQAYGAIGLAMLVMQYLAPDKAPYWAIVLAGTLLLLPEAAFVSNLLARKLSFLEFDFQQMFLSLWFVFLVAVVLVISLPVAIGLNAWAGLVTFIVLALGVRWLMTVDLAGYFALRVEREQ